MAKCKKKNNATLAKNLTKSMLIFGLIFFQLPTFADEPCLPCGGVITNAPLPTPYDCNRVAPFQNFVATYESCPIRGVWGGFYIGTGMGVGTIDYNLEIPGITLQSNGDSIGDFTNRYFIEYVTIGYSHVINRFFIAGELGYYYDSTIKPLFYEDPSSFTLIQGGDFPFEVNVTPCSVRLDINAHNHVAFDLMPGFAFTPRFSIFGRFGLEFTEYLWQRRLCFPHVRVGDIPIFDLPIIARVRDEEIGDTETDDVIDFRIGAGIAFAVCPHVILNLNYVHIIGSKATFTPDVTSLLQNVPEVVNAVEIDNPAAVPIELGEANIPTLAVQNRINTTRNEILFGVSFVF